MFLYPQVDFCIWVLEQDGLQVPPFDCHPAGDGRLQDRSMDADAWGLWVKRIVLLLDQRMYWHIEDLQATVDEAEAQFLEMDPEAIGFINNNDSIRPHLERSKLWQEEHYQLALAAAREVFGNALLPDMLNTRPTEVWQGESTVRELLDELWIQYRSIESDRSQRWTNHELQTNTSIWEDFPIESESLDPFPSIYTVAYPKQVEYVVPPASAILSITDPSCSCAVFKSRLLRVIKKLRENNQKKGSN